MKKKYYLVLFILWTIYSGISYSQNVKVSDYIVPISRASQLRLNGNWNYSQSGDSVTSSVATSSLDYHTFYSSLPLAWFINLVASASRSRGDISINQDVKFDARFQKYVWENNNWFGFAKFNAQSNTNYLQVASDITVGAGYGRYINATSLAKAVRIESHFIQEDVITDFLPKEVILKIADIIERETEYQTLYGTTYETIWFRDIEREIQASDMCKDDGIGSIGIMRMRQVLLKINEFVNDRYYGWDINCGILFPLTTYNKAQVGNMNLALTGRYSIPVSWSTQFNTTIDFSTPMDSMLFKEIQSQVGVDFIYELNNRVNLVSRYRFGLIKQNESLPASSNYLDFTFLYYIENNINFTINSTFSKVSNKPRQITSTMGLQYNFY